jgi:membrane protease YdiL (CAAX protease family)
VPTGAAVVVSSLAFAAAHLPGWLILGNRQGPQLLWLAGSVALLGCVLALAYRASGTLAVPMAVHAANNVLSGWRL